MKRTLITGGTGFVGANLARRLLMEGHEVHLLLRPFHTPWRITEIQSDVELHTADLSDEDALARVIERTRPEWLFHLAAHGAYSWQRDVRAMIETNITGTANLLHASLRTGFEAFINTGSSSEYGFKRSAPAESEQLEPNSYYAVTKASATHLCSYLARKHDLNIQTLRLYSVYGPFEEPQRLLPSLILQGLEGRFPPLASPAAAHDFVYVDDACDAYLLAANAKTNERGAVYNVGTGRETTLREVVEVARRALSIEMEPEWNTMTGREWDTSHWAANPEKIQRELNWHPLHTFEQGFTRTVSWFQENPEMQALYRERLKRAGAS